ncbi:MAG: hypothetical protein L6R43_04575 [Planctomycetes bacterium]|nr:hypothetical protein [Planctomycetota bacterium]
MATAKAALSLWDRGDSARRARLALPILVRQAQAGKALTYQDLGAEIDAHHRVVNHPLGCIGRALRELSDKWGKERPIPPIQCLVVNKEKGFPGHGFDGFMEGEGRNLTKEQRERRIEEYQAAAIAYPYWAEVLAALRLEPLKEDFSESIARATAFSGGEGGEESEDHRQLKQYIAAHPERVGVPRTVKGKPEFKQPSGDRVDVAFDAPEEFVVVEVKPKQAPIDDIERGLFQCVKYRAVATAVQRLGSKPKSVRTVLVLGGTLPAKLANLKRRLAVPVIESVTALDGTQREVEDPADEGRRLGPKGS